MTITGSNASEIFESVRLLVQTGHLEPGASLPSVRELAATLEVNRNTVAAAYKRLVSAGIAVTMGRNGTVIRGIEPEGEREGSHPDSPLQDLGSGNPDPALLPDPPSAMALNRRPPRLYGQPIMNPELSTLCRPWLAADCPGPFRMNLTHGAVDAVERLLAAHLVSGDKVALEDPCFLGSLSTLRAAGLQALPVPVDDEGMRADALEAALAQGAQAVIVTPRAHNPTGCNLSAARAQDLRETLSRYPHVLVICDDHFSLLAEAAYQNVIPAKTSRWALIRSVSKVLGPDLRMAFVASDAQTAQRLELRLAPGTNWVSHLLQDIVESTLFSPEADQWVTVARKTYASRRNLLRDALAAYGIEVASPSDGLNLWIPLDVPAQPVATALAQLGWLVRSGDIFGSADSASGLRITTSTLDTDQASTFARDLHRVLNKTTS